MAKNIVYFDLETKLSADEVGGWGNISKMRMSVGVTCNSVTGEYKIYGEQQVNELITDLQRADLVVGFGIDPAGSRQGVRTLRDLAIDGFDGSFGDRCHRRGADRRADHQ